MSSCVATPVETFVRLADVSEGYLAVGAAVDFASVPVEAEGAAGEVGLVLPAAQSHSGPFGDWQGRDLQEDGLSCNTTTKVK